MALDPFFQQGMNAWGDRIKAQEGRARGLGAMVDAGQIKDLLQRTGHQQKLAEGKQTGRYKIADTLAGRDILSRLGAEEAGSNVLPTSMTDNLPNILRANRWATNINRMGGPQMAAQQGQVNINPAEVLSGVKGKGPQYEQRTPTSTINAKLMQPVTASTEEVTKGSQMRGPGGVITPGLLETVTRKQGVKVKGTGPDAANKALETLTMLKGKGWEIKGDVTNVQEGQGSKSGKRMYQVTYKDGTVETIDESGKVLKTVGPIPNAPL